MRRRGRRARQAPVLPALVVVAGLAFLALSALPIQGSRPPTPAVVFGSGSGSGQALMEADEIRPYQAQLADGVAPPAPGAPALLREAAPGDALPVTDARPIAGSDLRPPVSVSSRDTAPIRVAFVATLPGSATSAAMKSLARDRGLSVYGAELGSLERPDVVVILGASTTGASVWFCGPAPNESSLLASTLLPHTLPLGSEPDGAAGEAIDASLPCSTLHAGRARMAAVYVRMPADGPADALAAAITEGVRSYLDGAEGRIRESRGRTQVVWPAFGPITSHYGPDHTLGIDIGQWEGDVVAAAPGIVTFAGGDPCCSYGLHVIVESPGGLTTLYGHLESLYVEQGDTLEAGQPLGPVGTTGHSSGVHLHFEVIRDGVRVNPLSILP